MEYPWYEIIRDKYFEQGDIFANCPIIINKPINLKDYKEKGDEYKVTSEIDIYDVIIVTQSCDLRWGKVDPLLVCPIYSLNEFISEVRKQKEGKMDGGELEGYISNYKNNLKNGNQPGYHLLNKDTSFENIHNDFMVVDFRRVFTVPKKQLKNLVSITKNRVGDERLRLLPPYKEHLSQGFARFFMRVGLPSDIEDFE